jgi:hypothetical protein
MILSPPFQAFKVRRKWRSNAFTIDVYLDGGLLSMDTNQVEDWRTDVKRFIEQAIDAKLQEKNGHRQ